MKILKTLALASVAGIGSSFAGETYSAPAPVPPVVEVDEALGFSLAAGYDSTYVFRGLDLGDNLVWTSLDYANDFGGPLEFSVGAWFAATNGDDGDEFNELDLYGGVGTSLGAFDVAVGVIYYYFPDDDFNTFEIYGSIGTSIGGLGLEAYYGYDTVLNGGAAYYALSAGYSIPIGDSLSLDMSAAISYGDDYNFEGTGFNNVDVRIALPIALTDAATLEPYIAGNLPIDGLDDTGEDDLLYGGVAISVSF